MNKAKKKPFHYARAVITPKAEQRNLQQLIDDTYSRLHTLESRTHQFSDGISLQTRHYNKRARLHGSQLHVVAFTNNEPTTIVPRPKPRQVDADLGQAMPPRDADYMDGEVFLLIRGNHVLICAAGVAVSDSKVARFIEHLVLASGASTSTVSIFLHRVADVSKLKLIGRHGVKALALNASMDDAGLRNTLRTSARKKILGGVLDTFKALVSMDDEETDDEARAHLEAEVTIKVDRYGRGEISQTKLNELAKLALDEDEGVRVVLTNGTVLAGNRISTHKYFEITHKAKGMFRTDALDKMDGYMNELKADGYFE